MCEYDALPAAWPQAFQVSGGPGFGTMLPPAGAEQMLCAAKEPLLWTGGSGKPLARRKFVMLVRAPYG